MGLLDKNNTDDVNVDFNNNIDDSVNNIESDLDDFSFVENVDSESKVYLDNTLDNYITNNIDNNVSDETVNTETDNIEVTDDENTDVKEKSVSKFDIKKLGHSVLVKLGKAQEEEQVKKPDGHPKELVLYMIMDKINSTTLEYFRAYGINVSKIFTNIKDAQDTILMQIEPFKLVIVDTGTGRFSSMGSRKEIVDAISLCEDSIDIFYTDTAIKSELNNYEALNKKDIEWIVYKSTADILAHLLSLHDYETYIYNEDEKDDVHKVTDDILDFSGLMSRAKLDRNVYELSLDISDIRHHIENGTDADMLESYEVKI